MNATIGRNGVSHTARIGSSVVMTLNGKPSAPKTSPRRISKAVSTAKNKSGSRTSHAPQSAPCKALVLLTLGATLATAFSLASLNAPVAAQPNPNLGENVTRNFKLSEVLSRRGKILIGTNVPSSLEFEENISEHVVGRDDLLIAGISKAKPNLIYFRAKEAKGSSSLDVTLEGGKTALFTFEIDPKIKEGLRYVIAGKSVPQDDAAPSPSDSSATPPPAPTAATPAPAVSSPKPVAQPDSPAQPLPDWVQVSIPPSLAVGGLVQLSYTLTNNGERDLMTDLSRLSLKAGDKKVNFKLARTNSSGSSTYKISPKVTQAGTLLLEAKDLEGASEIRLNWLILDANRSRFSLERRIVIERPAPQAVPRPKSGTPSGTRISPPIKTVSEMSVMRFTSNASTVSASDTLLVPSPRTLPTVDVRLERPVSVGVLLSSRLISRDQLGFDLTLENRGDSAVAFDPSGVTVSAMGATSPVDVRPVLYATLAPRWPGGRVTLRAGSRWSLRLSYPVAFDDRLHFEFIADVPVTVAGVDVTYRSSVVL